MKKFTNITDKNVSIDFDKDKEGDLSNDIESLDKQLEDQIGSTKLEGEWEIQSIVGVSLEPPTESDLKKNEAIIINGELGGNPIKRGDFIYITALINKKGSYTHMNQMGVVKTRITEIYNSLLVLNQIRHL